MALMLIGAVCNFKVVMSNSCKMPVKWDGEVPSDNHFAINKTSDAKYGFLGDIFGTKGFYMFSIGDLIMTVAVINIIALNVKNIIIFLKRRKKKNAKPR